MSSQPESTEIESVVVSKLELLQIHQQQLQNDGNNDDNASSIIHALGGIDRVLHILLTNKQILMTSKQTSIIHQIITTPIQFQRCSKPKAKTTIHRSQNKKHEGVHDPPLLLNPEHTYLSALFSSNTVHQLQRIIQSKYMRTLLLLMLIVFVLFSFVLAQMNQRLFLIFSILFFAVIINPYGVVAVLNVNRTAFRTITRSTDFWIKLVHMMIFCAALSWFEYYYHYRYDHPFLSVLYFAFNRSALIILIISVSAQDGYRGNCRFKMSLTLLFALFFFWMSISNRFVSYSKGDDSIVHIYKDIGFSVRSLLISSSEVIGIFLLKQCYFVFFRKGRASGIFFRPYLVWMENETQRQTMQVIKQNDFNNTNSKPDGDLYEDRDDEMTVKASAEEIEHIEMAKRIINSANDMSLSYQRSTPL